MTEPLPLPPQPEKDAIPHPIITRNPLKRLYGWVLSWAHHPFGTWALGLFAFIDSSFFPIPPLFLQVALSLERPKRSWWYAVINTVASVAGAVVGFLIGYALRPLANWIIRVNGLQLQFDRVGDYFSDNAFVFILLYSFLPFPYKVITIGSGVYHDRVALWVLLLASTLGRGFRFFALAALCFFMGRRVKDFIDRYFNLVTIGLGLLVAGVLVVMKVMASRSQ